MAFPARCRPPLRRDLGGAERAISRPCRSDRGLGPALHETIPGLLPGMARPGRRSGCGGRAVVRDHQFLGRILAAVPRAGGRDLRPVPRHRRVGRRETHQARSRRSTGWRSTRFGLEPADAIFVDDRADNVAGAEAVGMEALLFSDAEALRADLHRLGVLAGIDQVGSMLPTVSRDHLTPSAMPHLLHRLDPALPAFAGRASSG